MEEIQYSIIPDIHGQAEKLHNLLAHLGWKRGPSGWTNSGPEQEIVFLGDFIDRGPNNQKVILTVRGLIDSGKAHAVMGNHELNAILFHTNDPQTGRPLRSHTQKNIRQHASFLSEYPIGSPSTDAAIAWMRSLPLYKEFNKFRAVHACWNDDVIANLKNWTDNGVLSCDHFVEVGKETGPLFDLVETLTKGPEAALPKGISFNDKDGNQRHDVRVKWWTYTAKYWSDIAMSVPEPNALPTTELPEEILGKAYPATAKPVFFGHYWLTGTPVRQSKNVMCLDYSAGKDGPLLAYRFDEGAKDEISLSNVLCSTQ